MLLTLGTKIPRRNSEDAVVSATLASLLTVDVE